MSERQRNTSRGDNELRASIEFFFFDIGKLSIVVLESCCILKLAGHFCFETAKKREENELEKQMANK